MNLNIRDTKMKWSIFQVDSYVQFLNSPRTCLTPIPQENVQDSLVDKFLFWDGLSRFECEIAKEIYALHSWSGFRCASSSQWWRRANRKYRSRRQFCCSFRWASTESPCTPLLAAWNPSTPPGPRRPTNHIHKVFLYGIGVKARTRGDGGWDDFDLDNDIKTTPAASSAIPTQVMLSCCRLEMQWKG